MTTEAGFFEALVLPPVGWWLAGLLGALWGSFFNVAIHRLGLYESVVRPRSRCPRCSSPIAARDNLPIVGWLLLRGRCRHCRLPISARYPLVELLSLVLALLIYAHLFQPEVDPVGLAARFLVEFAFVGTLLVVSGVDLDHQIIPDAVTYPGIPFFFLCGLLLREVPPGELLIGMVAGYGLVALTAELALLLLGREGMGYGDAKLLALVGALLGWRAVLFSFFVAPFFGLFLLVPLFLARGRRLTGVEVPYGPFLAAAALVYLFCARPLFARLPELFG